ncbi:alpha/beta hydrolase [Hoeflea prorocentri]|uniref:Alpha/beta hydrolase n=1 Tax=Hoeflea prorocentri TaxID=1922333 RepID=A0A9X3UI98_9HYPH|nr:alpha/beta hydrolase [Hoeflea prorocentri]MCY6380930.1 alpha/beta hydrolase [Hoeflea prorocentri]MDA5398730.1 alpha/beta hydrolase [Hoeflea prorocentri]
MQPMNFRIFLAVLMSIVVSATAANGESIQVRPYKDRLFAYPKVLESRDGGAFVKIDYRSARDINKRDQVPELRARRDYVSLRPKRQQRTLTIRSPEAAVETYEVGAAKKAKFAVIFIHGRGGDRRLGVKDWTFGGNFNRLKNLAVRNGGVYYSPTIPSFDRVGLEHLKTLVTYIRRTAPRAPIVLACGSMGSLLCWQGSNDPGISSRLSGIVILGGTGDESFLRSAAYHARVPVLFAHGSGDSVYDWRGQHALYERVLYATQQAYPIRFVLFQSGSHGTPIRMVDWRDTLNWMFKVGG